MSALHPKADIRSQMECPLRANSGHRVSFDHFIGCSEQRRRDSKAERLSSLEVNHQLVLSCRLYREIGRLLALENTIDVTGSTPVLIDRIGAI
jgi:hypothetical protein